MLNGWIAAACADNSTHKRPVARVCRALRSESAHEPDNRSYQHLSLVLTLDLVASNRSSTIKLHKPLYPNQTSLSLFLDNTQHSTAPLRPSIKRLGVFCTCIAPFPTFYKERSTQLSVALSVLLSCYGQRDGGLLLLAFVLGD